MLSDSAHLLVLAVINTALEDTLDDVPKSRIDLVFGARRVFDSGRDVAIDRFR
jgi:hypothetical protein